MSKEMPIHIDIERDYLYNLGYNVRLQIEVVELHNSLPKSSDEILKELMKPPMKTLEELMEDSQRMLEEIQRDTQEAQNQSISI